MADVIPAAVQCGLADKLYEKCKIESLKVMLLGHTDCFSQDCVMKVTIAFNRFGSNCNQCMPRIRYGYAHVVNNFYDGWKEYAIGGSLHPLITSQANVYVASKNNKKIVRKMSRKGKGGGPWSLKSEDDAFVKEPYSGRKTKPETKLVMDQRIGFLLQARKK